MTITHISRRAILFGIAVIIALSLLALTLATLHGIPASGVSHTSAHLVSHGRLLADGIPPSCNPLPGGDCPS